MSNCFSMVKMVTYTTAIVNRLTFAQRAVNLSAMAKVRLDTLLLRKGLVESLRSAQSLIMAGQVLVADQVMDKPGWRVPDSAQVVIREAAPYVSRGGIKLEHALARFELDVADCVAADVGASTGGFTDCLLQKGARKVYAIDVGYGELAWRLRQDSRVVVLERTNIRYLESLPEPVDLATVDVSFISLGLVLPRIVELLRPGGEIVALIKPQFEAPRESVGQGGVVRDPEVHRAVLETVLSGAGVEGLRLRGLVASPLRGPAGNVEFFSHLSPDQRLGSIAIEGAVDACLAEAASLQEQREAKDR
jgi:23S rRNA (cytidine1920-2'-O)/16S rRNA (cytidine1409-2'-O)-methyltransferase